MLDEAGSLDVPVIASDVGVLSDRVTECVALFLPGDTKALAATIGRLVDNPAERSRRHQAPSCCARLDLEELVASEGWREILAERDALRHRLGEE